MELRRWVAAVFVLLLASGCSPDDISSPDVPQPMDSAVEPAAGSVGYSPADGILPVPDLSVLRAAAVRSRARSASARLFPVVIVHPQGDRAGSRGAPAVDNFSDALARVEAGGTIRVAPGTYVVDEVVVHRPVTIEATGGERPLIRNESATFSFRILGVPDGKITFRGLDFVLPAGGRASIQAYGVFPEVVVEDASFDIAGRTDFSQPQALMGVEAGFGDNPDGRVLVDGSSFRGGWVGTFAWGGARIDVRRSSFRDHVLSGIQYQSGGRGFAEANELGPCGVLGCVRVLSGSDADLTGNTLTESRTDVNGFFHNLILYAGDATGTVAHNTIDGCGFGQCFAAVERSVVDLVDNDFTIYEEHGTRIVVVASDGTVGQEPDFASRAPDLTITDNTIVGVGGSAASDPTGPDVYAIKIAGILVENAAVARAFGNHIENAEIGIQLFNGDLVVDGEVDAGNDGGILENGSDNVVTLVRRGLGVFGSSVAKLRSTDLTDYVESIAEGGSDETSDLTCNWWGSAAGPLNTAITTTFIDFTPWATSPVAGTSTTSCSGGP